MIATHEPAAARDSDTGSGPGVDSPEVAAARAAALEAAGEDLVGEHVAEQVEESVGGASVVTHFFASRQAGYTGWRWAVTVVRSGAAGSAEVTIDDVVLLPGEGAITAPAWVPWRERIRPGDLSPGDILPADEDDPRLVPAYLEGDADVDDQLARIVADEVGLGRSRVLSVEGRDLAFQRWYGGERGPASALAQSAPHHCGSCGFLVRLAGPLSTAFGVCANEFANDDGSVVALDHGCGAHSGAQLRKRQLPEPIPDPAFDTISRDDLEEF